MRIFAPIIRYVLLVMLVPFLVEGTDFVIDSSDPDATVDNVTINGVSDGLLLVRGDGTASSGNGVYRNILLLNGPGKANKPGTAAGYNYDGSQTQPFDQDNPNGFDPYVRIGEMPVSEINGVQYVGFALDSLETGGGEHISIDEFRIYSYSDPNFPNNTGNYITQESQLDNLGTLVYDIDAVNGGGDNDILLELYASSSGNADLSFFIPVSYFYAAGVNTNDTLYLWAKSGERTDMNSGSIDYGDNGGAEQWSILGLYDNDTLLPPFEEVVPVPEPSTIIAALCGLGLILSHFTRRLLIRR